MFIYKKAQIINLSVFPNFLYKVSYYNQNAKRVFFLMILGKQIFKFLWMSMEGKIDTTFLKDKVVRIALIL